MKTDDDNEAQGKFKCTLNPSSIECSKTIGRGSFGLVKRATLALHSQRINVAVKILSDSYVKREKEAVANELRILRDFEHINIVKLYGCFKNGDADPGIGIVLELMSCSLEDLLYTFSYVQYKCSQVVEWMLQCSKAIAYLHDNATVHRDLKPANLLLNQTFRILKVSDFGTARLIDPIMSCRGTSSYMAPEVILGKEYDMRCDVYSIGIILSELMTRQPPQNSLGAIEPQIIFRVPHGARPDISKICCSDVSKLIAGCWSNDPRSRPFAAEICIRLERLLMLKRKTPKSSHFIIGKEEKTVQKSSFDGVDHIERNYLHQGVSCVYCKQIIRGLRFRCTACDNIDFCQRCYKSNKHSQHISFRFDCPYRDEPRFTPEQILTMQQWTIVLENGRRLKLEYAMGKRPKYFLLSFINRKHLLESFQADPNVEQLLEDDHFGAYYSKKRETLDVVMRDMKSAPNSISFILQALDYNDTVIVSAEEHIEQIIEAILKTIIFLSITEDFRKVKRLIFYSNSPPRLKTIRRTIESVLFSDERSS